MRHRRTVRLLAVLSSILAGCAIVWLVLRGPAGPLPAANQGERAHPSLSAPASPATTAPASPSARPPASPNPPSAATPGIWRPAPGTSWQWQLTTPVDQSVEAAVYDIDLFENPASVVAALHAAGRKVVCYVSVGSWEPYRPDAAAFPASVLGGPVQGFPDERWLDIRQLDVLTPIMGARLDLCRSKGFDAVEADLVEAYAERTGLPLTAANQLAYNRRIAALAHERGLSVGLKNDAGQVRELVGSFDFAVVEQCVPYEECPAYEPFVRAGKAVFETEYDLEPRQFCPTTVPLGFSSMRKRVELDAYRRLC